MDLTEKPKGKLRTGFTTGTCATAASKAAILAIIEQKKIESINVLLPKRDKIEIKIKCCDFQKENAKCTVIKDGGDDPDVTHGAEIIVDLELTSKTNIIEIDGLLAGGETVATQLQGIERSGVSHLVANDLVQTPTVGIPLAFLRSLFRRHAGKEAGSCLGMDVLTILVGAVQTRDHGDVLGMLGQGLHRGGELQRIDTGIVLDSFLVLGLVGVESTHETGQNRIFLTWEKVAAQDTVGEVHHDELLGRLGRYRALGQGPRDRMHERQGKHSSLGSKKVSPGNLHCMQSLLLLRAMATRLMNKREISQGKDLLFVHAAEAELVAYPGYLAVGELHLDELGAGKWFVIRTLQGSDPLLGLGVEDIGGVAVGIGAIQTKGNPTMPSRTEVDVPLGGRR